MSLAAVSFALLAAAQMPVGAQVTFDEQEAEQAVTDGTIIGPDRQFGTIAAEASGRRAVRLDRADQTLVFTLPRAANALTVRYAIPDSADGKGQSGQLDILVSGERLASAPLSSRFGWFYGRYPFTNNPADGLGHHFFDEVRVRLPRLLPAGTRITLRRAAGDQPSWVVIDLVDFERIGSANKRPANALSVVDFGADASGRRDAGDAFTAGIAQARRTSRPLWIPPGTYRVDRHLIVDRVTLVGAGPWYSILTGTGVGVFGHESPHGSSNVHLRDFTIDGRVTERDDKQPLFAIGGAFNRSSLENLFLHHTKVGVWLDGPMHDLRIAGLRITDQTADGINLHRGVHRATIEQNFIRNTGDDGIALWSDSHLDSDIVIRRNTAVLPILANGIALYGGQNLAVGQNRIVDTLTEGGGVHLGTRFRSTAFRGRISVAGNWIERSGSLDPRWHFGVGAIWLYALEAPIAGSSIRLDGNRIIDSSCEALQLLGPRRIEGVRIEGLDVEGGGDTPLALQTEGQADALAMRVRNPASQVVAVPKGFDLKVAQNMGWTVRFTDVQVAPRCVPLGQPPQDSRTINSVGK